MTELTAYRLRGETLDALYAKLEAASTGKARPYLSGMGPGTVLLDEARVTRPWTEQMPGAEEEIVDPMSGETISHVPLIESGAWLCDVILVDMTDSDLALLADFVSEGVAA